MSITKEALYLLDAWERGADANDYFSQIAALRQAIEQAEKESALQEIADIGQEIEQEPESWMGVSDNPYCNDVDCNDPNGRAMRWHNKLLELRKQVALDGLAETSREIEQEPHPCDNGCQFAKDVGMPEQTCGGDCQYNKAMSTKPENIDTKSGCVDGVNSEPVAYRKEAHGMWFYIENKPSPPNDDYEPLYTAPPKPQNELDAIERAYFAGKEAGIAESKIKRNWHGKEPVAYVQDGDLHWHDYVLTTYAAEMHGHDLFTEPPKREWVDLTETEAAECWTSSTINTWKRIQAKLKEKNNG